MSGGFGVRASLGWQLVLADLSLILFLTTASALSDKHERGADDAATRPDEFSESGAVAALYLASTNGPAFGDWLTAQPRDPREQLTIRADYNVRDRAVVIQQVETLAEQAARAGFTPRIIIEPASESQGQTRITASFAFDGGPGSAGNVAQLLQSVGADTSAFGD